MNLFDMLRRKDRSLVVTDGVEMAQGIINGDVWRGLNMSSGSLISIPDPLRFFSFRAWPDTCGWFASLPSDGPDLEICFHRRGTQEILGRIVLPAGTPGPIAVRLPWPTGSSDLAFDLVLRAVPTRERGQGVIFLANHRALSRKTLLDAAKGVGVEIGPGAQPQILPSDGVEVSYVEQMPPEEWNRLYNRGGKYPVRPELWSNYVVGDASQIPFEDGSLDFIFGSHVFEHLANPIGHLARWNQKLKSGGHVLCVIPDLAGTKDAVQQLSTLAEWQDEFDMDIWNPTVDHYVRHMRRGANDPKVRTAIADRESIHVHYYTNTNSQQLLSYACEHLGFGSFSLTWTPNHKDFHFRLTKA